MIAGCPKMYKLLILIQVLIVTACQDSESSRHRVKRHEGQEVRTNQQPQNSSESSNQSQTRRQSDGTASRNTPLPTEQTGAQSAGEAEGSADTKSPSSGSQAQEEMNSIELEPQPTPTAAQILSKPGALSLVQADQAFIEQKMREFTGDLPVLINNTEQTLGPRNNRQGKDLALQFLQQEYEKLGFVVSLDNYGTGINLVAEKKGTAAEQRVLIVGAHYDSVASVGADDDASGIIGSLAIAKALESMEFDYTLRFIAFDEEELGLIGSANYANSIQSTNESGIIIGAIILEMLGYDGNNDSAFHIVDCKFIGEADQPEGNSGQLSEIVLGAINLSGSSLQRTDACTDRSDHTSFWNMGVPAVVLSQDFFGGDSNPCYHDTCDTIELLDYTYMSNITSAAAMSVASLLSSSP